MERLTEVLKISEFSWLNVVEILIVAYIIYRILLLIRGTRAVQALLGVTFLLLAYEISLMLRLDTLHWILMQVITWLPIAIIVIFQNTIRRALADFGRTPVFRFRSRSRTAGSPIDEIVLAATTLSTQKIGAIIVLERSQGLRNYAEAGVVLDSLLRYDLLITIFNPRSPLHDGAVIVQGNRILAAACFLPLTTNPQLSKEFGSRHRAALGITEETDAVAVVVSEEKGAIAYAAKGEIKRYLTGPDLKKLVMEDLHAGNGGRR